MMQSVDALELLLPGAGERAAHRARAVVQFLRLLSDDASPSRAGAVGVGLAEARGELECHDRGRVEDALCDLLRHHLVALSTPDSFLGWGEPTLGHPSAWRLLDEFREEWTALAVVPEPGESALEVVRRLVESLADLGSSRPSVRLWQARIARFSEGPRAAEKLLRAELSATSGIDPSTRSELEARRRSIACVAECLLDRGAVREAREWLSAHGGWVEGDPRLRQLLAWTLLCLGDYGGAKRAVVGLPPWAGALPAGLVELRAHRPEWLPCLAGKTPAARSREALGVRAPPKIRDRGEIGAAVFGVFVLRAGGEVQPLVLDVAPGLRQGIAPWLRERDGACTVSGEREHDLVVQARPIVVHRNADVPIQGALGREATRALALAPILDDDGEVAGWLHVECEHHLLPATDPLTSLARTWRDEVLARRAGETRVECDVAKGTPSRDAIEELEEPLGAACAEVFEELVADLGIKTAQRRWWGFVHEFGRTLLAAQGGEASGLSRQPGGRGRALTRAIATLGRVSFDEPDPNLSLDERAASGVVLPLSAGGRLCGLLAVESSRRRDFREADWLTHAETVQRFGLTLSLARFRGWHRQRFGFDVWFDARRGDFRAFALPLLAAARSRSPVVLSGPAGSGKMVLARWIHFESRSRDGPVRVVGCGSPAAKESVADWLASASEGSLVLEDVDRLQTEAQEELLRLLEDGGHESTRESSPARILATSRTALNGAVESGRLRNDLAHRLDRLQFRVPALQERREDILPLVACLSRRFSDEEDLPAPSFDDEALAYLWRQRWDGNVRELESFVYKLVLLTRIDGRRAAPHVGREQVRDIACRFSMPFVRRLPSRHPQRSDLIAALRVTRKSGGRPNKTRAALYLGWDPDTLVSRLKDAGIGEDVRDEDVWLAVPNEIGDEVSDESSPSPSPSPERRDSATPED